MICSDCPRRCRARRDALSGDGYCGMGATPVAARAALHFWEEPCVSGTRGSGAVFFSGCALRCVYCQNAAISADGFGKAVTPERLREIYLELAARGAHNVNLVNPTHFNAAVIASLANPPPVPVIYNCGGYESVEALRRLEGKIDIYLPDLKYLRRDIAAKYSNAPDYPETAAAAIEEMFRQRGPCRFGADGVLQSGVLIRHLVLPGQLENTFDVIDWVRDRFAPGEVLFSLMGQYLPCGKASSYPELNRPLAAEEYARAQDYLMFSGLEDGFVQDLSSADRCYIPEFDLSGV